MTDVENVYNDSCQKIDPWCIDAYFKLDLTPTDSSELTLDNSWAPTSIDLSPAIKKAETVTHLSLTDDALQFKREDYGRKGVTDGGVDCIYGDNLSKIISMRYLKDVAQTTLTSGDVYMYGDNDLFEPFALQSFVNGVGDNFKNQRKLIDSLRTDLDALGVELRGSDENLQRQITANDKDIATNSSNIEGLADRVSSLENNLATLQQSVTALSNSFNSFKTSVNNRLDAVEATIARPSYVPNTAKLAWGTINNMNNTTPTTKGIWTHNPSTNTVGDLKFD